MTGREMTLFSIQLEHLFLPVMSISPSDEIYIDFYILMGISSKILIILKYQKQI